jgi:D-alanine-D-alanine ligase
LIRSFNSPIIHISPSCDVHCSESTLPDLGDLHLPVIVKPVDSGSSLGVSKVTDLKQLPDALSEAFDEAKHVLIEQFIVGREITVGVVRLAGRILVLPITEIIQSQKDAFYDAAAKFGGNTGTKMITPADLAETTMKQVEAGVSELYEKLELSGLVQFDLILEQPGDKVFFLEVDSTPSQASNSIISQQLTKAGWAGKDQVKFYKQLLGSPR